MIEVKANHTLTAYAYLSKLSVRSAGLQFEFKANGPP